MEQLEENGLREMAAWSVARGSLLFHLDLAASLARDHVVAQGLASDADGWFVDIGPNGYEVCFLADHPPRELLSVTFAADGAPIVEQRNGRPSLRQRALAAAARTVVDTALSRTEAGSHSVIVVPPAVGAPGGAGLEAYMMRRADRPGDIALGIHRRLWLDGEGLHTTATEPLSRAPLVLAGDNGRPPLDVTVTHFGPVPSEAHVYLSLKHGVPLSVVTLDNEEQWIVDGETISLL